MNSSFALVTTIVLVAVLIAIAISILGRLFPSSRRLGSSAKLPNATDSAVTAGGHPDDKDR
jgi:hypothetical protein